MDDEQYSNGEMPVGDSRRAYPYRRGGHRMVGMPEARLPGPGRASAGRIHTSISEMDEALDDVINQVGTLIDELAPILKPDRDSDETNERDPNEFSQQSSLADDIDAIRNKALRLSTRLRGVRDLVDL